MKAIFAVSALAAAIATPAFAADTEATTSYTGGVKVEFTQQLSRDENENPTPASSFGENGDDTSLSASVAVANGPFSGTIKFSDGDEVEVEGLKVDNGTFAFGDIGGIISTEGTVDGMKSNAWATDSAFRYTNADLGLKVQVSEGNTERKGDLDLNADDDALDKVNVVTGYELDATNTAVAVTEEKEEWDQVLDSLATAGLDVAYSQDLGVATVTADLQYRVTAAPLIDGGETTGNEAAALYAGVKAVAMPVEMLTLTAGFNTGHGDDLSDASDTVASYGVKADVAVMEGVTAYGTYAATDVSGSDPKITAGAAATFGPATASVDFEVEGDTVLSVAATQAMDALTLSADVEYTIPETGDNSFEAMAKVAYAVSEMTSASVQVTSDNGDNLETIANVTHKLEDGITFAVDYENDDHTTSGNDKDGSNNKHELKFTASYSF
jgi:hypothetical protein